MPEYDDRIISEGESWTVHMVVEGKSYVSDSWGDSNPEAEARRLYDALKADGSYAYLRLERRKVVRYESVVVDEYREKHNDEVVEPDHPEEEGQ